MSTTTHHCNECGLDYFYEPALHVCATKGRNLPGSERRGESWIAECMRKQHEPARKATQR